jgi:hypothetical protein
MYERYLHFMERLPRLARRVRLRAEELTFQDLVGLVTQWLSANPV